MWHVASKEYQKVPRSPKVSCGVRGGLYSFVLRLGEIGPPSARVVFFFFFVRRICRRVLLQGKGTLIYFTAAYSMYFEIIRIITAGQHL